MNISEDKTIGEIVAHDYRTAFIFEKFGLDYCCKGNIRLSDACQKQNISVPLLIEELNRAVSGDPVNQQDFNTWPLDLLADYVEKKHHAYVTEKIPVITRHLDKICQAHGKNHQELFEIHHLFDKSAEELTVHMKKEEFILFPYIRRMVTAKKGNLHIAPPPFGKLENPIQMMMHDHDEEGERFRKISALTHNYNPPSDACNTYKVSFALLKEFEKDLHMHIHLENNILFPKAIAMEQTN